MTAPPHLAIAITGTIIVLVFGTMLTLETIRPLRRNVEERLRRIARNLTMGAIAFAVATPLQLLALVPLSRWMMANRFGLLNVVDIPPAINVIAAVILLDYTLWIWHWANHRVPFLWRFHLVHHVDRDLDASTALRFHFGEHALSTLYRGAQIVLIGASPFAVWVWQAILFASILFHHSNVAIPVAWERRIVPFIVTPRMHGIHHSDVYAETNSNWSSLLSVWDRLHRTLHLAVPQQQIRIGVPAFHVPARVTIGKILMLPFVRQGADWQRVDGGEPDRAAVTQRSLLAE